MKVTLRKKELKDGNISLYLDIYDNGKRRADYLNLYLIPEINETAKTANKETLELALQIRAERVLNPNTIDSENKNKPSEDGNIDNTPLVIEWIEHYITVTDNDDDLSDATVEQTRYFKKLMEMFLKEKRKPNLTLGKFDKGWFSKFFNWLKNDYVPTKYKRIESKPLSPGTLRNIQQRIVAVFNRAVRDGVININPFDALDKGDTFVKPTPSRREILTPNEMKLLMSRNEISPGVIESQKAFIFACLTGLRISDVRELKWSNITSNGEQMVMIIVQKKTKTMNAVPIGSTAKQWMPEKGDDDYVFHLPSSSCVYDNIRRVIKNVGIKKEISFHTSRHTFGTLTLAATKDLYTTMRLLGHKDIRTTSIYAEVLMEDKINAVKNTDSEFKTRRRKENLTIPKTKRTAATNTHPRKVIDIEDNG